MNKPVDPRLDATRNRSLEAALSLLQENGVLAVTHAAISTMTGISRSTLYRHWPNLEDLRNAAFARAAKAELDERPIDGPLKTDLLWMIGHLMKVLNEAPWGKIAPQIIGMAATEDQTRELLRTWIDDRSSDVAAVIEAARDRGELRVDAPIQQMIEMAIAIPYFRKLVAGRSLDPDWLESHVDLICGLATKEPNSRSTVAKSIRPAKQTLKRQQPAAGLSRKVDN